MEKIIDEKTPDEKIINDLYLNSLSRYPKESEKKKLLTILEAAPESEHRQAVEDVYWAVLSSKEFLFNH